jgi:hypothetical protein
MMVMIMIMIMVILPIVIIVMVIVPHLCLLMFHILYTLLDL